MDEFRLGTPEIVCRWRVYNRKLPLENRHLRALGARQTSKVPITSALVAWAKQHLEWTLEDGSALHPNGVLMLVLDVDGKAAMTVGEYESLPNTSANDLLLRAKDAWREAQSTRVSPEDLWIVQDGTLVWGTDPDFKPAGASSLVYDLACTLGMPIRRDDRLLSYLTTMGFSHEEVFLVSDEHGVVPASDHSGDRAKKFQEGYKRLLASR